MARIEPELLAEIVNELAERLASEDANYEQATVVVIAVTTAGAFQMLTNDNANVGMILNACLTKIRGTHN